MNVIITWRFSLIHSLTYSFSSKRWNISKHKHWKYIATAGPLKNHQRIYKRSMYRSQNITNEKDNKHLEQVKGDKSLRRPNLSKMLVSPVRSINTLLILLDTKPGGTDLEEGYGEVRPWRPPFQASSQGSHFKQKSQFTRPSFEKKWKF